MDEKNLMKWLSPGDLQILESILEDRYGIEGPELRQLPGEFKNSFVVMSPESARFVVKLTDVEDDSGRTHLQADLLEHLAARATGLPVPRVVRARDGAHVLTIKFDEREALLMMLTWLPGQSVSELSVPSPELLWEIGETAARFVEGLSDFGHPSAIETHEWHILDAATNARSLLPLIVDHDARSDVIRVLHWYDEVVLPTLDQLRVGIV